MAKELSLELLLQKQHGVDKKLLEIQKRTSSVIKSTMEKQSPANEPIYDLYWLAETLYLELELPGVSEDDISVDLTPSYLKISGTVTESKKKETVDFLICKRQHGPVAYMFNLPTPQMTTPRPPQLNNGVLFLQLQLCDTSKEEC